MGQNTNRGLFIVFEGIDGSGKSSLSKALYSHLKENGVPCMLTCEPTLDNVLGLLIREYLKDPSIDESTMSLLFAADRVEHVKKIKRALKEGTTVICDRYIYSNFVYQGEFPSRDIHQVLKDKLLVPDLTFFIDADPDVCIGRIAARGKSLDKYETLDNLERMRKDYRYLLSHNALVYAYPSYANSIIDIDGNTSIEEGAEKVISAYSKASKAFSKEAV